MMDDDMPPVPKPDSNGDIGCFLLCVIVALIAAIITVQLHIHSAANF